jgi:hypothetical protein
LERRARGVLTDRLCLAALALPAGWCQVRHLNAEASLQARQPGRGRFVLAFSESRDDFEPAMTMDAHSERTRALLSSSVRVLSIRGPEYHHVAGFDAVQYEIDAAVDLTLVRYLHTTIAGDRAFHQILCWATPSGYDRAAFEQLLGGFREVSGPLPAPAPRSDSVFVVPVAGSRYDVH